MINNVVLVGRIARDAEELRYRTPNNQAVATFSLAVNRNFKSQNGEREIRFHQLWSGVSNEPVTGLRKVLIGITGRIQTHGSTTGQRVYVTEVVDSFQLLESRAAREEACR